jgi:antitoxin CptB
MSPLGRPEDEAFRPAGEVRSAKGAVHGTVAVNRGRVRWHCRRALLELDLVFTRFLDTSFDQLSEAQLEDLEDLLLTEDHDLWAMVNGSRPCTTDRWKELIGLLRGV